jgi:hypothetical protein
VNVGDDAPRLASTAKLLPAMRTGLPHSISSVTTAPTTAIFLHAFDLTELNGDDLQRVIR